MANVIRSRILHSCSHVMIVKTFTKVSRALLNPFHANTCFDLIHTHMQHIVPPQYEKVIAYSGG